MAPGVAELRQAAWYPVASSDDLPFRHVYHGQLLGQELAIWRADDGYVNVWENRCLHRGVRLSIGINDGAELKCQYHGWRYANRTAGCTYIPAHPADAPARRITNRTYPVRERAGLVWAALSAEAPEMELADVGYALRPVPVDALPEMVLSALVARGAAGEAVTELLPLSAALVLQGTPGRATYFVQPVDSARAVIRGVVESKPSIDILMAFNAVLSTLRDEVEAEARGIELPQPIVPRYEPVSVELATMPDLTIGRQASVRVRVARRWQAALDVTGIELAPLSGHLPTFQPGAHIDLHLPNGMVRQYSITNGPGELTSYVIAVKREADSRGGSVAITDTLREDDVLAISEPRNNFPLRRDAVRTTFIAGGIGLTPLLSMARALLRQGLEFDFHAFARSEEHLPLGSEVAALGAGVTRHFGLSPAETAQAIGAALGPHGFARHVYICGPGPMLEVARTIVAELSWPDEAVHYEYFRNSHEIDTSSTFTVELARSALSLAVPAGKSILEVMRENGVDAPSSCEQGACGTCLTRVLDGEIDHQDVYLNAMEKAAGNVMMTCVSRARSARLVLDI
jgi:ferredoxin-NADP reductase/nitrite reductase/ring-hydroxylating ferredoxin subunit